jgi:flagellar basal-body rod modification protein FlgD
MPATSATNNVVGMQSAQAAPEHDKFQDVDLQEFIKMLIAELSNQDPMNPMDNHEILQQVSQIREIESNDRLTDMLETVRVGQSLSTATTMIGRKVKALTDSGDQVVGVVDRISVGENDSKVFIGNQQISLKNVSEILSEDSSGV